MLQKLLTVVLTAAISGLLLAPAHARAEEEEPPPPGWHSDLVGGLAFTQTEFENYAEGGESALTWTTNFDYSVDEYRENREWKTDLNVQFGQSRLGDGDLRKASDRIALASIHSWKTWGGWNPFVAVDARSQFAKSFVYSNDDRVDGISRFANPFYFNQAAGIARQLTPWLNTRLGFAVHEVFTTEEKFAPLYTDDPETAKLEKSRVDTGLESVTEVERKWEEEKVNLKSQLRLFSSFDDPATVDVFWNTKATATVLSFVSVILETEISYDEDILKRTQLKEVLSVGLTHTFF